MEYWRNGVIANYSAVESIYNSTCMLQDDYKELVLADLWENSCIDLARIMYGRVFPSLAIFITILNSIVVAVFLKPKIRSNTSFLLTLIALTDILNILCPSTMYVYFYTFGNYSKPVPFSICRWMYYLVDVLKDLFNMTSLWLTVLLAYVRTRCISSPFKAYEVHNKRNLAIAVATIVAIVLVVHVPSLFIYDFHPHVNTTGTVDYTTCKVTIVDIFGKCVMRKTHLWMEIIIGSFLPCIFLLFFNLKMLVCLRKANHDRNYLYKYESVKEKALKKSKQKSVTVSYIENGNKSEVATGKTEENLVLNGNKYEVKNTYKEKHGEHVGLIGGIKDRLKKKRQSQFIKSDSLRSNESAFERLHRESRRTSWYIVLVVTLICSHEVPLAALYSHTLLTHPGTLPPVLFGCSAIYIVFWQYVTYSLIFLIYCCMCSAFRAELWKTLTCRRTRSISQTSLRQRLFVCPCVINQQFSRSMEDDNVTRPAHNGPCLHLYDMNDDLRDDVLDISDP